jgi:hypothetical protein
MGERQQDEITSPAEILARLIKEARQASLYIEQQDIHPIESQRAAHILPVIEEEIERRSAELDKDQVEAAYEMAKLMETLARDSGISTEPQLLRTEMPSKEELLTELDRIANEKPKEEGE